MTELFSSVRRPKSLPFLLLLAALSTVFLFGNDRGHFYRNGHHNFLSSHGMTLAANLSPAHNFLMFDHRTIGTDSTPSYAPYNRFPIGAFALTKLAVLLVGDEPTVEAEIYAARTLMLAFFAAAAALAYLSLGRLAPTRWVALSATLLTFSSYYCLYYNDMVWNDVPSLFGVMLTFHGMVVFAQDGRFRQLLVKTCAALLLGWQVLMLLLPFVILGLLPQHRVNRSAWQVSPLCNRYLTLGIVALLFSISILAFNFVNEYFMLNDGRAVTELPSFQYMLTRIGQNQGFNVYHAKNIAWLPFLQGQLYRIGGMSLPFALPGYVNALGKDTTFPLGPAEGCIVGIAVTCACLIGLKVVRLRHKILPAALVLSGFCWALPLRHFTVYHDFQSLFYIGIPLVFFFLVMLYIYRLSSDRLIAGAAAVSLFVFGFSAFRMSFVGHDAEEAEFHETMIADFKAIRKTMNGADSVFVAVSRSEYESLIGAFHAANYYLAGSVIEYARRGAADLFIARNREDILGLLTPNNRLMFLYDRAAYDRPYAELGDPAIESNWNVHLRNGRLVYIRNEQCGSGEDFEATFFFHIVPRDENDLPDHRKQYGFDNLDFSPGEFSFEAAGRCIVERPLPAYAVSRISTGQYIPVHGSADTERIWEGTIRLDE